MKIALCSDVHLEFGPLELFNDENADVLILSGDICVASDVRDHDAYGILGENVRSNKFHTFFQECCARFPHVVYIAGNHEHYNGDYARSLPHLKEKLGYLVNLHILDKESVLINDVMFVGGTLWTDMNKEDPITLSHIKGVMNDYRIIENSNRTVTYRAPTYKKDENGKEIVVTKNHIKQWVEDGFEFKTRTALFSPEDSVEDHKAMLAYIDKCVKDLPTGQKVVVVGHHAPSKLSVKPRYVDEFIMNGAYSSDLSEFILDNPKIKLWTHGHTHDVFDYMIGSTRIVCNPRGYIGYEQCADDFKLMYLEV
jgi:Icc-related predicted phosphoesterase